MRSIKQYILIIFTALLVFQTEGQNIGINEDGSNPDPSAILDIKANNKGFLAPRLTEAQRNGISSPATGLMIYQIDNGNGFYFYDGTAWVHLLSDHIPSIQDLDQDTRIHVESSTDDDKVRFSLDGIEYLVLSKNGSNVPMMEMLNCSDNTLLGENAGQNLAPSSFLGVQNVFVGKNAGDMTNDGSFNSFVGTNSGSSNSAGYLNSFIGHDAGYKNEIGSSNTFIGQQSGYSNISGSFNSFVGQSAGYNNVGYSNTMIGQNAGFNSNIADFNVFVGERAGFNAVNGSENVLIGSEAGLSIADGDNNVMVGNGAGKLNAGTGNVFIGSLAGSNETASNKLYISNNGTSTPLIKGDFASNEIILNGKVTIGNSLYFEDSSTRMVTNASFDPATHLSQDLGNSAANGAWDEVFADDYVTISDMRSKENVKDLSYGLEELMQVSTISYSLIDDPFKEIKLGLNAQNILSIMPEVVKSNNEEGEAKTSEDQRLGLKYDQLIPVLINCIQEQQKQIEVLKKKVNSLKN
ncbi:MAG: tail fiber domain-containing protein [Flavobacteriales bacterium]|nr:tail fiber domain-containing protein [Flavobacteriales bacterium]